MSRTFRISCRPARVALSTAALLLALPGLGLCQGRGDPAAMQERINREIETVIDQLELTEEEADITRTILADGARQRIELMREMRSGGGQPDFRALRESMAEIDLATEELLGEFLSEETMKEFREIREKRREEARSRREARGGRGPSPPGGRGS